MQSTSIPFGFQSGSLGGSEEVAGHFSWEGEMDDERSEGGGGGVGDLF